MSTTTNKDAVASDAAEGKTDSESAVRLLNLHEAARYLGLSYWTMRDYVLDGIIARVELPCSRFRNRKGAVIRRAGDRGTRRILIDRTDLDKLVERSKEQN